jgi:hypothetical protein
MRSVPTCSLPQALGRKPETCECLDGKSHDTLQAFSEYFEIEFRQSEKVVVLLRI